jgi:hypothetical protein
MAIEDAMRMDSIMNSVVTTRLDDFVVSTIRDIIALDECKDDEKLAARRGQGTNKRQKTRPDDDSEASKLNTITTKPSEEPCGLFSDGVAGAQPILEIEEHPREQGKASSSLSTT